MWGASAWHMVQNEHQEKGISFLKWRVDNILGSSRPDTIQNLNLAGFFIKALQYLLHYAINEVFYL